MTKNENWLVDFIRQFTIIELIEMVASAIVIFVLSCWLRWS